jgi:sugar O-acyltransferase (sialic acid O-acetyltransferase NeuD family)
MNKENIILIGAGGHALSCIDVIEQENKYNIHGLVGLKDEVGKRISGYNVIATQDELVNLSKDFRYAFIAIGQIKNVKLRIDLYESVLNTGFKIPSIISPQSFISRTVQVGEGTIIMNGVILNSGVRIGNNCIINSKALIEHGTQVADHCHISTGAILNGDCVVESKSFVGSGAIVKHGITIKTSSFVNMGKIVTKNSDNLNNLAGE